MGGKGGKGASAPSMDMASYTNTMNEMNTQMVDYQNQINDLLADDWKPDIPDITIPDYDSGEEIDWGEIGDDLTDEQRQRYMDERDGIKSRTGTILTEGLLDDETPETTSVLG